jgi:hypothetical protein
MQSLLNVSVKADETSATSLCGPVAAGAAAAAATGPKRLHASENNAVHSQQHILTELQVQP